MFFEKNITTGWLCSLSLMNFSIRNYLFYFINQAVMISQVFIISKFKVNTTCLHKECKVHLVFIISKFKVNTTINRP